MSFKTGPAIMIYHWRKQGRLPFTIIDFSGQTKIQHLQLLFFCKTNSVFGQTDWYMDCLPPDNQCMVHFSSSLHSNKWNEKVKWQQTFDSEWEEAASCLAELLLLLKLQSEQKQAILTLFSVKEILADLEKFLSFRSWCKSRKSHWGNLQVWSLFAR